MVEDEEEQLLFFDTFTHEAVEDNLDLVKFPCSVVITELRIVPLGAKVHADVPGKHRLGATIPHSFKLDFFVTDLNRKTPCTFEKLGIFEYQKNVETKFKVQKEVTTDGLILRGLYSALTLAIFGKIVKKYKENRASPPPPPPPPQPIPRTHHAEWEAPPKDIHYSDLSGIPIQTISATINASSSYQVFYDYAGHTKKWHGPSQEEHYGKEYETYSRSSHQSNRMPHWNESSDDGFAKKEEKIRHDDWASKHRDYRDSGERYSRSRGPRDPYDRGGNVMLEKSSRSQKDSSHCRLELTKSPSARPPSPPPRPPSSEHQGPQTPKDEEPSLNPPETHHSPSQTPSFDDGQDSNNAGPFEEIVSDEDMMSDGEERLIDGEYDQADDRFYQNFDPIQFEITPLQYFSLPGETEYEVEKANNVTKDFSKLESLLSEFRVVPHDEKWVEAMESITEIPWNLPLDLVSMLIDWALEGLNLEEANKQPVLYKIRQLKAGIQLTSLLLATDSKIIKLLLDASIPSKLMLLLEEPHMSLPLKVSIIKALDLLVHTKPGMNYFISTPLFPSSLPEESEGESHTCYKHTLELILKKQTTRMMLVLTSLLKKVHFYELVQELVDQTKKITDNYETDQHFECFDNTVQTINTILTEILNYLKFSKNLVTQLNHLPALYPLELTSNQVDPVKTFFRMMRENMFLETLFALYSCPATCFHSEILFPIKDILQHLLKSQQGSLFLLSSPEVMNGIVQTVLINKMLGLHEGDVHCDDSAQILSIHMICHFQSLLAVDWLLFHYKKENTKKQLDDPDTISVLRNLYMMVFEPSGRQIMTRVFTLDNNLEAILCLLRPIAENEEDKKQSKSVCVAYAIDLLMMIVNHADNVEYLHAYREELLKLGTYDHLNKLHILIRWLNPLSKTSCMSLEGIPDLLTQIKELSKNVVALPVELLMCVRVLRGTVLPSHISSIEELQDPKHKIGILKVFAHEGLTIFLDILQSLHSCFLKPYNQNSILMSHQCLNLISLIFPIIQMLQSMLSYLIRCRGSEFKDFRPISILLHIHSLMSLLNMSSSYYITPSQVQTVVVDILLAYTQPALASMESDEALSESLWTLMLKEVLKYTTMAPSNFLTGFAVLSELLPLPLPIITKEPLSEDAVNKTITHRKLWSAHLQPLAPMLQTLFTAVACTTVPSLSQSLRRLCVQLADLAPPTSLIIIRSLLDSLDHTILSQDQTDSVENKIASTRIMGLLSYFSAHSSFKNTMLNLWRGSFKSEEKYIEILNKVVDLLTTLNVSNHFHEFLIIFIQALCDPYVGYASTESGSSALEVLANNLPSRDQLSFIIRSLIVHLSLELHPNSLSLPYAYRTLCMLCDHDYGYYHVKQALDSSLELFPNTLKNFTASVDKTNVDSVSIVIDFLLKLAQTEDSERTFFYAPSDLATLVEWPKLDHPFQILLTYYKDQEEHSPLVDMIQKLISLLETANKEEEVDKNQTQAPVEPVLPASSLSPRPVFQLRVFEEPFYNYQTASDEGELEQVPIDLIALSEKCFKDFDLKSFLEELCISNTLEDKHKSSLSGKRKLEPLIGTGPQDIPLKKPFIAPMRGRGFNRGGSVHSSRPNDPFRSRPPNTSRPPSMHVDDFLALETGSPSSTPNKRLQKDIPRGGGGGGRGRPIFSAPRGRSFSSLTYPRRENGSRGVLRQSASGAPRNPPTWLNGNRSSANKPLNPGGNPRTFSRIPLLPQRNRDSGPAGSAFSQNSRFLRNVSTNHWPQDPREIRFESGGSTRGRATRHSRTMSR